MSEANSRISLHEPTKRELKRWDTGCGPKLEKPGNHLRWCEHHPPRPRRGRVLWAFPQARFRVHRSGGCRQRREDLGRCERRPRSGRGRGAAGWRGLPGTVVPSRWTRPHDCGSEEVQLRTVSDAPPGCGSCGRAKWWGWRVIGVPGWTRYGHSWTKVHPPTHPRGCHRARNGRVHNTRKRDLKRWIQGVWGSTIGENDESPAWLAASGGWRRGIT